MSPLTLSGVAYHKPFGRSERESPSVCTLSTGDLDGAAIDQLHAWLSADEIMRAERFLRREDRRDFIAAHGLLRMHLRDRYPGLPLVVPIGTRAPGEKPVLSGRADIDFNISHTSGMVACASALNADIGIDCEALDRKVDLGLAEVYFSRGERDWLSGQRLLPAGHAFLHLWTLKEATIKAIGLGLRADLTSFTVLPFPPRLVEPGPDFGAAGHWTYWQETSADGFVLAVAKRDRIAATA